MNNRKKAARAKAKAKTKARSPEVRRLDKLASGIKPKRKPAPREADALVVAAKIAEAIVEGVKMATNAIASSVLERAKADQALAAKDLKAEEDLPQTIVHALGVSAGGLSNPAFRLYLSERGIALDEMDEVRDAIAKLSRAFYIDPEAERE